MSVLSNAAAQDSAARSQQSRRRANRLPIVGVMILSLLGSAGARYWADESRAAAMPRLGGETAVTASLGGMNSFALGLLLGGLRGPLVMILWTQSETSKSDKDLEGVDTQIEWIRLLQPEFDTVHIFQIWNKAYNISVQMASMANKYDVILGALDYAYKVDAAKPDDINIIAAIGQLYFDKLGTSTEKLFYRKRVREQTLPHPVVASARSHDAGWRRVSLDPILDESFKVLPNLTKPKPGMERTSDAASHGGPGEEHDDGADLQYLPQFGPYPDGVSTFGLAYNYYKRAEVLQNVQLQHHDQLSDLVIDSRPALSLKYWGEEELEQGRRREIEAFGLDMPENVDDFLGLTEHITLDSPIKNQHAFDLARNAASRGSQLFPGSLDEYHRHILHFPEREIQYRSYMQEIADEHQLAIGDYEFLTAMVCPPAERNDHLTKAMAAYLECRRLAYINLLRYYVDRSLVIPSLPQGFAIDRTGDHRPLEELALEQAENVLSKATDLKKKSGNTYVNTDRVEFDRFIDHASVRESVIQQALRK